MKTIFMQNECPAYGTLADNILSTIQDILIARWDNNYTPFHFLAQSLNPRFYSHDWLNGGPSRRFSPHMDGEISYGRKEALRRIFWDRAPLQEVEEGFI